MFKDLLLPLDGSKLSEASLESARYIAKILKSRITLLHIIEEDAPKEVHHERHLTEPGEAEEYLKIVARKIISRTSISSRATTSRIKVHVHRAPVSDVAASIARHAETEFKPSLIIISSHGQSGIRDFLFGSIAQQIVSRGKTPLLIIKPNALPFKIKRVLVPLDPESGHDTTLSMAQSLGEIFGAKIHLMSVVPTFSTLSGEKAAAGNLMPGTTQILLDIQEQNTAEDLAKHVGEFQKRKVSAQAEVLRGDPVTEILRASELLKIDLIVLSTHGKAGTRAFWARSVAPKVVQQTKTPILLMPLSEP